MIFIDAVAADTPPGTIRTYTRDEITCIRAGTRVSPTDPPSTTPSFAGTAPREVVLVGVVPETPRSHAYTSQAIRAPSKKILRRGVQRTRSRWLSIHHRAAAEPSLVPLR